MNDKISRSEVLPKLPLEVDNTILVQETHEKEPLENRIFLVNLTAGIFFVGFYATMYLEFGVVTPLRELYIAGKLNESSSIFLEHVLNHTNNFGDPYMLAVMATIGELFLEGLKEIDKKREIYSTLQKITPFVAVTIMFGVIMDAETVQISKGFLSQFYRSDNPLGTPDLLDLPITFAGLIGASAAHESIMRLIYKVKKRIIDSFLSNRNREKDS